MVKSAHCALHRAQGCIKLHNGQYKLRVYIAQKYSQPEAEKARTSQIRVQHQATELKKWPRMLYFNILQQKCE